MLTKFTIIFLKDGMIRIDTQFPYVVDIKKGQHLDKCNIVYHGVYYTKESMTKEGDPDEGICCYIKHDTILSRDEPQFKKIMDWEALTVKGELYNSVTGSCMTLDDDDEQK